MVKWLGGSGFSGAYREPLRTAGVNLVLGKLVAGSVVKYDAKFTLCLPLEDGLPGLEGRMMG